MEHLIKDGNGIFSKLKFFLKKKQDIYPASSSATLNQAQFCLVRGGKGQAKPYGDLAELTKQSSLGERGVTNAL